MGTILKVAAGVFLGGALLEAANIFMVAKFADAIKDNLDGVLHAAEEAAKRTQEEGTT